MDATHTLTFVVLGALLGMAGQGVRAMIGIKKEIDDPKNANRTVNEWFDGREMAISFILGAVAGILAALTQYGPTVELTKNLLFGFVAAGYSGADFIGGIMQKWLPSTK
jgi:hypothetical protein